MSTPLATIILAAGKGTRMNSDLPKVLHTVGGKAMIEHVLRTSATLNPERQVVITGHGAEYLEQYLISLHLENLAYVRQPQQLGTGHAVLQAADKLQNFTGDIIILMGDAPLISSQHLQALLNAHASQQNTITVGAALAADPTGCGRIIRNSAGDFIKITEQKDASPDELKINEINAGLYVVSSSVLFKLLHLVGNTNAQKEYYLTDIVALALSQGHKVGATVLPGDARALQGINTPTQLMLNEGLYQDIQRYNAVQQGIKMLSPETIFFAGDVTFGKNITLGANVTFAGNCSIADGVIIEGNCYLNHAIIGERVTIKAFSHLERCRVDAESEIGPFARLRTGTHIHVRGKIGNFVETKNLQFGKGSKASHLSYLGDAVIGTNVNIGAGTITCNYDGANKNITVVENDVFIGSNSALIAPVTIGEGATIGAGSTITRDVKPGSLSLTRPEQKHIPDYIRPTNRKG